MTIVFSLSFSMLDTRPYLFQKKYYHLRNKKNKD
jgi:hypothetical protein